ncbi:hypothetical protein [Spartinivicinus poritis]|uniref:DUF333 domain-containing protein n=1 Tax=Spartinivicinus poritis TaxID=2994640 RepID=A0ABT5UA51_9GAMM|nr:hypothetical protein [Spartinivicinus sp. A2-2]MDE1462432.1 hypothetical protein [Spartinivicinus sp. A2-2]
MKVSHIALLISFNLLIACSDNDDGLLSAEECIKQGGKPTSKGGCMFTPNEAECKAVGGEMINGQCVSRE